MNSAALRRLVLRKKAGAALSRDDRRGQDKLTPIGLASREKKIWCEVEDERVELNSIVSAPPSILATTTGVPVTRPSGSEDPTVVSRSEFIDNMALLWKGTHAYRSGRNVEQHLKINLTDTILFEKGEPRSWLFTSQKTGRLLKKSSDKLSIQSIIKMLGRNAEQRQHSMALNFRDLDAMQITGRGSATASGTIHSSHNQFVCVVRSTVEHRSQLRVEFLRSHQLLELFTDKALENVVSLQAYAGAQGCANSVYSCRYRLKDNSIAFEVDTYRLTDDKGIGGSKDLGQDLYEAEIAKLLSPETAARHVYIRANEFAIKSKAGALNAKLEQLVVRIVRFIEATRPTCQIGSITAEFVCSKEQDHCPPTLTHISNVEFRKPILRKVDALSARFGDIESVGSLLSSRSSSSSEEREEASEADKGEGADPRQHQSRLNGQSGPQVDAHGTVTFGSFDEKIKHIAKGPAKHVSAEVRGSKASSSHREECWGQYCGMSSGETSSSKGNSSKCGGQLKSFKAQRSQADTTSRNDGHEGLYKVLLLSIIQAEMQQVEIKRNANTQARIIESPTPKSPSRVADFSLARDQGADKKENAGMENEFSVAHVGLTKPVTASTISAKHSLSTWRLYSPVDVCETCFHVYQTIDHSRPSWESKVKAGAKETRENKNSSLSVRRSTATKISKDILNLIKGKDTKRRESAALARPFFCSKDTEFECTCQTCQSSKKLETLKLDKDQYPKVGERSESILNDLTCVAHTGYCFCRYCYEFRASEELPFRESNREFGDLNIPKTEPFQRTRKKVATANLLKKAQQSKVAANAKRGPLRTARSIGKSHNKIQATEVVQPKTYRVTALQNKLSAKLDLALATSDSFAHPPLLSLRRKSYIPHEPK